MALFGPRCWRCGMRRLGARRFCPACGADVIRPEPMVAHRSRRARPAGRTSPSVGRPPLDAFPAPRLRGTVWHARPMSEVAEPPGRPGPGSGRRRQDLGGRIGALDGPTRRKLARLTAELALLTVVVAVVYGGPAMRGGARPPATIAPPTVRVATLGLAANEITTVFAMPRFGDFEFSDEGLVDGAPLLAGVSADGATTFQLWGHAGDLQRVTTTCELREPGVLDGAQRRHIAALLALYAPNALEPLLQELRTALDAGRASRSTFESGRVSARLNVAASGSVVSVALLPARLAEDEPDGAAPQPAGSPEIDASPSAPPS